MRIIRNEDAQFMILAGFIIAIGLVITTILLSSIIFEVNIAQAGGSELSKNNMVNLIQITKDEFRSAYVSGSVANFNLHLASFSGNLSKVYALHGEGVKVTWDTSNWSNDQSAAFTDDGLPGGDSNWTLVENVRNSNITVNISSVTSTFIINITNATKSWNVNFTTSENRNISNSQISANITSPYSISFNGGSDANGKYRINGTKTNNRTFIRARDYILNGSVTYFMSRVRTTVSIPVQVPW